METLRDLRKQAGKTLAEVANVLNVGVHAVYNYENGSRCINIHQVMPLSFLYDVTAEEIIEAQTASIVIGKP